MTFWTIALTAIIALALIAIIHRGAWRPRMPALPHLAPMRALLPQTAAGWAPFTLALILFLTVLLVIPALFPSFSTRYVEKEGPVFWLFVVLALIALAALVPWTAPRRLALGLLGVILLLSVTPAAWEATPAWSSAPATADLRNRSYVYSDPRLPLVRTGDCPGKVHQVTLDANWQTINPHGKCRIIHQFSNHPVEFRDLFGAFPAKGHVARNPESVRATAGTVMSYYSLCPLETGSRVLNWDCTNL